MIFYCPNAFELNRIHLANYSNRAQNFMYRTKEVESQHRKTGKFKSSVDEGNPLTFYSS